MSSAVPAGAPAQGSPDPSAAAYARLQLVEQQLQVLQARGGAAAAASSRGPKAPPMTQFTGLMGAGGGGFEVDQWLRDAQKQFDHYGDPSPTFPSFDKKVAFAVQWMSGAAQDWWENEDKSGITSWDAFVERLRQRYRPQMPAELARQRLRTLVQRGRCETYCNEFLKLVTRIPGRSEEDKIFDFKNGLDHPLAAKVAEKHPKTLQEAMEIAVQAEPYVTLRTGQGQRGFYAPSGMNAYGRTTAPNNVGAAPMDLNYVSSHEDNGDAGDLGVDTTNHLAPADPMQLMLAKLEAMETRLQAMQGTSAAGNRPNRGPNGTGSGGRNLIPGLTATDVAALQKEGRCFRCKQKGHMKNECPQNQGRLKY